MNNPYSILNIRRCINSIDCDIYVIDVFDSIVLNFLNVYSKNVGHKVFNMRIDFPTKTFDSTSDVSTLINERTFDIPQHQESDLDKSLILLAFHNYLVKIRSTIKLNKGYTELIPMDILESLIEYFFYKQMSYF